MNPRLRLILIISGVIVLVILVVVTILQWRQAPDETITVQLSDEELNQQHVNAIVASSYEKLLFVERPSSDGTAKTLSLAVSDFLTTDTAVVNPELSISYSNFIPETSNWFTIEDNVLFKHTFTGSEEIARINSPIAEHALRGQITTLAVSNDVHYVAWVSTINSKQQIVTYDLVANTETTIFNPDIIDTYTNLTWSPDSTELAFTDSHNNIITISPVGAQLQNPFSIEFTEFNHLTWIEPDNLAAVVTSTETAPEPFNPKVIVFNRQGEVLEEHNVLDRAGIPRVVWSPDAKHFLFFDQWKNNFVVYNRFNKITQRVSTQESGKLIPFGWTTGIPSADMPTTITPITNSTITIEPNTNSTAEKFVISAEQWDQYNESTRGIVKQFKADMSSYRFETTNEGVKISLALLPGQTNPEASFVQILLQTMVVLPDVPTISLDVLYNETDHLVVTNVSSKDVETIVDTFTTVPLNELFTVNTNNPYGKARPKVENPNHSYFGDLLYSRDGLYNPIPVLAALKAVRNESTYFTHQDYALLYPKAWQRKDLAAAVGAPFQDGDVLFFTGETNFASTSSWSGFSMTIRKFGIPEGASINDWLLVNRNDSTIEDVQIVVQPGLEAKKVVTGNAFSSEYVTRTGNTIYVFTIEHPPALTADELKTFDDVVASFSDTTLFDR